jgi:hypothetical protein
MWLGTRKGRSLSLLRDLLLRFLLRHGRLAQQMGRFYAMLTIPFNTLARVPQATLPPRAA